MNALFVLCGIGIVSLLAEIINIRKGLSLVVVAGLAATVLLLSIEWDSSIRYYNNMVVMDNFSIAFCILIALAAMLWFLISKPFFQELAYKTDRFALIVFAVMGAFLMVSFNNLAILFLGLEILSISLYVLAGSRKRSYFSNEASFKYFLMGSFATGFFLFGVALLYGATGSFDITRIASIVTEKSSALPQFFYVGILLIMVGMAFKMSAAPFHFWAPDVYEGSPTVITAFMSTVVKIAAVGAFFKMFVICFSAVSSSWIILVQVLIVATLVMGNLTAVYQINVKRVLAYSSVGHVGFILLAMISSTSPGIVFYYLAAYSVASIAAFAVVIRLEKEGVSATIETFQGLFKRNSLLAVTMTVALFSLAGIPPLAGFFAKYLVFASAIENGFIGFVILGVITSLIGVYYYFGIVKSIFSGTPTDGDITLSPGERLVLLLFLSLIVMMGIFPDPIISLLSSVK
jgi:NADH-quinone oxidoreductase subunit N